MEESRAPAPGGLRRVQEFINSEDIEQRTDQLSTPQELVAWLASHELLEASEEAGADDVARAREVRAALRDLADANNGGEPPPGTWEVLNRATTEARLQVSFGPEGAELVPAEPGVRGALGRLLAEVYLAMQEGTWPRLKACRADDCRWAFYDHSKNRSGAWCSMAVCGNRAKTRTYRRRSKQTASAGA